MENNKLYKVTRKILDEIIKASDSRIMDTKDTLAKAIEKAKAQLEVLDELADSSLPMDLTAPGPRTIPTPHQGPNTITVPMAELPGLRPCDPYSGHSVPRNPASTGDTVPVPAVITAVTTDRDANVWPPEANNAEVRT